MSDWSIRLARPRDAEHLPAIEKAAGTLFNEVEGLAGLAGTHTISADRQRAMIRQGHSLVAESGGRIIGFISTERFGNELHIREFSVHPRWQRQGIGAVLLRALEIDARNTGFQALTLTTFSDVPWNAPFYARLGFVMVKNIDARPRLKQELATEVSHGLPRERRCAMIKIFE